MKKYLYISSLLFFVLLVGGFLYVSNNSGLVAAQGEHSGQGKEVTLKGEVVDLHCYMLHPDKGKGTEHASCAKSCINRGLPIGFLSDGQIYLLLGQEHNSAKDLVVEYAGKPSVITGTLIEHDGAKAIQVKSIKSE